MNSEGYRDPTADKAVAKVTREADYIPEHIYEVVQLGKSVFRLAHLRIKYIEFEDEKGKVYRKKWRNK